MENLTAEQILEGNRAIAEFMGWKVEPFDVDASEEDLFDEEWLVLNQYDSDGKRIRQISGWDCANICSEELEMIPFDHDWSWLMPVLEKIDIVSAGSRIEYKDGFNWCWIWLNADENPVASNKCILKIDAVYKTVIEYLKWLSTNPY